MGVDHGGGRNSSTRVSTVRAFNRYYTQKIGVLHEGLLNSAFSLAELRVLYELANRVTPTASDLCKDLGLDPGYLSRILRGFEKRRLIVKTRSPADGRHQLLALTAKGKAAFAPLDARARDEIAALLDPLSEVEQRRLIDAIRTIQELLGP